MRNETVQREIVIVQKDAFRAAGLQIETSFAGGKQAREVPPFFHETYKSKILDTIEGRMNTNTLCIFMMKPNSPDFSYFMGTEVRPEAKIPDKFQIVTLEKKTYASMEIIKKGNEDVGDAFAYIIEQWLPVSHWIQDKGPAFIYYDSRFFNEFDKSGYEGNPLANIYVPILPKE